MKCTFVFGPAKSGKTTYLNSLNTLVVSGNNFLYQEARAYGRTDIEQARIDKDDETLPQYNRDSARGAIINFVENTLIRRVYGSRKLFVSAAFRQYNPELIDCTIECLNTEELRDWQAVFNGLNESVEQTYIELHREGITYRVDSRTPPPKDYTVVHLKAVDGMFVPCSADGVV